MHESDAPSPWIARWAHLVPAGSTVPDVACVVGRHALYFSRPNHPAAAIDIAQAAIDTIASKLPPSAQLKVADIENGPWPLMHNGVPQQFGTVVASNYLWRALLPNIVASVPPGPPGCICAVHAARFSGDLGQPGVGLFLRVF